MNRFLLLLPLFLILFSADLLAQRTITGTVVDEAGDPLPGAYITVKGSTLGTSTDADGTYSISVPEAARNLVFSFLGFGTVEIPIGESDQIDAVLSAGTVLDEVVLIGSRSTGRTKLTTPVPVDIVNVTEVATAAAQTNVNQLLNYVAPSFSSNTQTISDGTDHIDPASLRGLGPDQVLVLINGKRRHNTSLVNVNGTFGRGNVGTDLNSIPVAAIERIEILRDGASAQYGSDAIAGVINIILKEKTGLSLNAETGAYVSSEIPDYQGSTDGEFNQISANYGIQLNDAGGVLNVTGVFDDRDFTNRMKEFTGSIFSGYNNPASGAAPGEDITESELVRRGLERSDFNMRVGQSALRNGGVMYNLLLPVAAATEVYAFGGLNYRRGNATGFYRLPNQNRTVTDIYPNGFLPAINSNISDASMAVGLRSVYNKWEVDFSNVYGRNGFGYLITNTLNASLGAASPTSFDAGGFSFAQNTANLDIRRYFDDALSGLNVAFGAEYRLENYQITAGEQASYYDYGAASAYRTTGGDTVIIRDGTGPISTVFDPLGRSRPGGAQVFPGFRPDNEVDAFRSSVGAYADVEADITDNFLLGAAVRFENYSDFGSTVNGKLTTRVKLSEDWTFRAGASTGFRAPSLHQLNFNSTSTLFVDGVPFEVGVFSNDSRPAQLLGIPQLKQERSVNYSGGFTGRIPDANLSITIDGYLIDIADRVVLTGQFQGGTETPQLREISRLLQQANANRAAFFANAIDSRTRGIDVVVTHNANLGSGRLTSSLAATFAKTTLEEVNTSSVLEGFEDTYFDRTSQVFLESAVPRTKANLTFDYQVGDFGVFLRNVFFGPVNEATNSLDNDQTFSGKVITDLSASYQISERLRLVIGSNNLLDVYPDLNIPANQSDGRFLYSRRSQQFGSNGRYLFARVRFTL
ncbi:iron complex outermembrane receptor protein [Lewinella marina]|uniref:TonB-dependent receptor n=1 Tax=Neolewinella marina TaxID=438751 RepID=A0A2G0CEW7_9BACT|nr:TonB-dependent receptor [Neolewinella marina]NJB85812.1 iron complex outermembrane receptor protein [Neolewinella marina]PHK98519.1 TonB-dependent receptor [Neolewinella marina]